MHKMHKMIVVLVALLAGTLVLAQSQPATPAQDVVLTSIENLTEIKLSTGCSTSSLGAVIAGTL